MNDAGSAWVGSVGMGTAGTLSNTQCTINAASSSVSNLRSTDNVVNLAITFASSFSGTKNVKMHVEGAAGTTDGRSWGHGQCRGWLSSWCRYR